MQTVKREGVEYHVGCGGVVVKGTCISCGAKKPSLSERLFGAGPTVKREKFDEQAYRDRIRKMKDI